jgi:hypothetical protein
MPNPATAVVEAIEANLTQSKLSRSSDADWLLPQWSTRTRTVLVALKASPTKNQGHQKLHHPDAHPHHTLVAPHSHKASDDHLVVAQRNSCADCQKEDDVHMIRSN